MPNINRLFPLVFCLFALSGSCLDAQTMDTVVFGNTSSESNHSLTAYFSPASNITSVYTWANTPPPSDPSATPPSDVVAGGLGLSARRLLPRTPNGDVYGGQVTFTMAVDPVKQNYFTLKLWAADPGAGYLVLNCNGKEIGNRHGGGGLQEDPLWFEGTGWYGNRFFYRTEPLPLSMTHGKTSVTITVRSLGTIYDYAPIFTYVPNYQQIMNAPSFGLYTAYTHAGSIPDVTGEVQGTTPTVPTPRTLENETTALANVRTTVNNNLATYLKATGSSLTQANAYFLAECYDAQTNAGDSWITYPTGMTSANVGSQIIAALDALVTAYAQDPTVATNNWGGALGQGGMSDAIRLAWPLLSSSMSTTVAYGGTVGTVTRQTAWSTALRASLDSGRYNRRTIANQDLTCSANIYYANRALLLVNPANALNESEALRYYKEASGIQPWIGNDLATGGTDGLGGGPIPTRNTNPPYGPNWYMCTTKGTTKDGDGFVGSDYGEQGPFIYRMGLLSGDAQVQARGILMTRSRCQFRYPGVDESGYAIMMGTDPVGDRNNNLPSHYVYLGRGFDDDFLMASQGAAAIGNDLLGFFQQGMNDGQMVRNFDTSNPYLPTEWAAIKAMSQMGLKLPTTSGQPDYAWVDEENMAIAAKHGEERFYANLYWRQPGFINGLAKVFHLTPTTAHLADVMMDDERFRPSGQIFVTGTSVDSFATPPDNPIEAFGGLCAPIGLRSDLTAIPATNRDAGRGTGYTLRYGNWLVGIDADYSANYTVQLPSNFTSAPDLVSGKTLTGSIVLTPRTSVVLYLPTNVDPSPPPARTLFVNAAGGNGSITVGWYAAGSATSYNVLRSTTSGGPYTTIATGVTGTTYLDSTVTNGTTYYYVIQSVNAIAVTSGNSPEASATPVAPETATLSAPWNDADIGTSTGGNATLSSGTFTLKSGIGDIYGTIDGCHFAYQTLVGDGVFTARVVSQTSKNNYAKAGVMIRDSLAGNAAQASINLQPVKRVEFDYRGGDGGSTSGHAYGSTLASPYWLQLVRTGPTVTSYVSPDGATWTLVGSYTFSGLPNIAYVGLCTSPANSGSGQTNTAVFDNVTMPLGATAAPSAPTGLTVAGSNASAILNWSQTANATNYNVKRGTSASGPFTTLASGVALNSASDFGLTAGTYYYVVSAVNSAGESANSSPVSVQVGGAVPSALLGLTVAPGSGQVALSWNASTGATGYIVTRSFGGSPFAVIASGVTGTSFTDTGLTNGTLYYYGVAPVNANGQGQGSQTTALPPGGLPSTWQSQDIGLPLIGGASYANGTYTLAGNGTDIWGSSDQLRYAYQGVSGNCVITARVASIQNTTSYKIGLMFRNTLDANSAEASVLLLGGNGVGFESRGSAGGSTSINYGSATWPAPTWLRLVRTGSTFNAYVSADGVTWTSLGSRSVTMNTNLVVGLAVCSNISPAINIATFDNVSLNISLASGGVATASAGTTNQQAAQAFDGNTSTKWYNGVNGGTGWLQYQFGVGASQVVTQYQITSANDVPQRDPASWQFQGSNNGANWTTLDTQTGQAFASRYQANVYNVTNTTAYSYYRLNITANAGGSGYGLQLSELTLLGPNLNPVPLIPLAPVGLSAAWGDGQIALSWPSSFGATTYNVKRATVSGGPYITIAPGINSTSYTDNGVTDGTTYYYVVTALNPAGESGNSPEDSATPLAAPAIPSGVAATPGDAQAILNWTAVPGATSYDIQRSTVSGGPYTTVGVSANPTYTDSGLANNTTYYYVIAAMNLAAESSDSSEVSAQPSNQPTGLVATAGNAQVGLSWTASYGSPLSYNVYRSTTSGSGYAPVAIGQVMTSFTDTNVANGTTYYYVVTGAYYYGEGTPSTEVSARPMPPIPVAPTGVAATGGTAQVSLSWTAVPYAASYNVYRSTTNGGPYTAVGSPTSASYTDVTLAGGTTYYYVVTAVNISGEGAASIETSAPTVPDVVTGLAATAGSTRVGLSWNMTVGATSYNVGRATTSGGPYTVISSGSATTSFVDTVLTNGVIYYYVVSAVDAAGAGLNSAEVNARPMPPLPAAPISFAALAGNAQVSLSWAATTYTDSYAISRATTSGGPYTLLASGIPSPGYVDGSVTNGTTYYYVVTAVNLSGEGPNSSEASAEPLPPLATSPTGLAATGKAREIDLNWSASTYAATYNVKRSASNGGPYSTITTGVTGTNYNDTGLTDGTAYYYVVSAVNLSGEGSNSTQISAITLPGSVTGLAATAGAAQVMLTWSPVTGAATYTVGRSTAAGGPYTNVVSSLAAPTYTDTGLTNGTTYYYVVAAVNASGTGPNSTEVNAKPVPPVPTAPTGLAATGKTQEVDLTWSASTYAATYNVKRSATNGGPYITVASGVTATSYNDSVGLADNTPYYYVVSAVNVSGESVNSTQASATTLLPIPVAVTGLVALANSDQVTLSWTAVTNAATYNVLRLTTSGAGYVQVATGLTATSYTDTGLTDGTTYYYVVAAVNATGTGPNSTEVNATPAAQNLYWDTTTATGLANGSNAWNAGVTATWSNSNAGTSNPLLTWFSDDNAFFQTGGAFTVTIATGTTIKLGSLNQSIASTVATVTGGTLQIDSNAGITNAVGGDNGALTLNSALALGSPSVTVDNETTSGSVILNGVISETGGSRALVKIGAGALQFGTAANSFTGGVSLNSASQVTFSNTNSFGTGTITFNGGTSLTSLAQIYTSSTSGIGSLANSLLVTAGSFGAYTGDHTMILSGSLLNTGGSNGTFVVSPGSHAANVTLSGDNHAFNGAVVYNDNAATTLLLNSVNSGSANANWTLTGGSTKGIGANVSGANTFLLGEVTSASGIGRFFNNQSTGTATFVFGDATANSPTYGGIVANGTAGGKVALTKAGADTQVLTGASTYTGPTTVSSGTLLVNGSLASGSTVTVNSGATLGGSGKISGATNLTSGGIISPGGSAVATLTFSGGLNLNGGGVLNFDLGSVTSSDKISVASSYVAPASGTATINLNAVSGFATGTYTLVTGATGISATNFTIGTQPPGYTYQLSAKSGILTLAVGIAPATPTGLAAIASNSEIDLAWSASSGATSYNILRSTTNGSGYTSVATGVTTTSYIDTGLANGTTYYYVVAGVNTSGVSANSNQASATPFARPIVDSWFDNDIGSVGLPGSSSYSAGTFTLNGSGLGFTGASDGFDFTYQPLVGDGTIIARVASISAGESGVVVRETLTGNSRSVSMLLKQSGGALFQYRTTVGGTTSGTTTSSTTAPYWVKLARVGNAFRGYISPDGVTWTQVGSVTNTMASSVYVGLAQSSLSNTTLSTGTFTNVSIVPTSSWSSQDIGSVPIVGASYYSNAVATINGSGTDIGGTADQFRYTYLLASGNCDITARVTAVSNSDPSAKAGVMIRETLTTGSRLAAVYVTPGSGITFQWRSATSGTAASTTTIGLTAPYWVRVVRSTNTFTAYSSTNGTTWTSLGSQTISMATAVYIGLPACSHTSATVCTATLDNITADP